MKKWKKIGLGLLGGFLGICALLAGALFLPFPIEGNWEEPRWMPCIYGDDCHDFLRFEKGKIVWMSDTHFPPILLGTYQRKGWGKYESDDENFPGVWLSTFFRLTRLVNPNDGASWTCFFFRDRRIWTCRKAVNHPSNEWMAFIVERWLHVTGTPEKRMFSNRRLDEQTKEQLEAKLDYLLRQPLQIYTASNEVPSSVLEALDEHGIDCTVHVNQEWVASDTLKTNPVWNAIERRTMYGLIITPRSEEKRYGDARYQDDYQIYLTNDGLWHFEGFRERIGSHRWRGDYWKKNLRLYVKDGVLPDDVKQLFAQFDLEYTVFDDRVLYRGKENREIGRAHV